MDAMRSVPIEVFGTAELLAIPVLWCVFVGFFAVVIGRRRGIPRPPLAIPGGEPGVSNSAYDIEATERRIRSLEERLDFAESLLDGRSRAGREEA